MCPKKWSVHYGVQRALIIILFIYYFYIYYYYIIIIYLLLLYIIFLFIIILLLYYDYYVPPSAINNILQSYLHVLAGGAASVLLCTSPLPCAPIVWVVENEDGVCKRNATSVVGRVGFFVAFCNSTK